MNISNPRRTIRSEEDEEIMSPFGDNDSWDDESFNIESSTPNDVLNTLSKNICYVKAQNVAIEVATISKELAKKKDFLVLDNYLGQLVRSSSSVAANMAEGSFCGNTTRDKMNKFRIAAREAIESINWITLLMKIGEIPKSKADELIEELSNITCILSKSIKTMQTKLNQETKKK